MKRIFAQMSLLHKVSATTYIPIKEKSKELDSTIAKDLNDSEDPKHTLFCCEIALVAIYAFFGDDISIL